MSNKKKNKITPEYEFSHLTSLLETEKQSKNSVSGYKIRNLETSSKNQLK